MGSNMPSRVSQDALRVDEINAIPAQHVASSASRSETETERSPKTHAATVTVEGRRSGTLTDGAAHQLQLASLANTTSATLSSSPTLPATQNSTTIINPFQPAQTTFEEGLPDRLLLSPPLSPNALATTSLPLTPRTGYFAPQPAATGIEPCSPPLRRPRPPASRSSNGIETASGPPPALSTQRSYIAEPAWKQPPSTKLTVTRSKAARVQATNSIDSVVRLSQAQTDERDTVNPGLAGSKGRKASGAAEDKMLYNKRSATGDDQDRTLRTLEGTARAPSRNKYSRRGQEEEQSQFAHEDLFLNLAHADSASGAEPLSRLDRRRSQSGLPNPRHPHPLRPSSSGRSASNGKEVGVHENNTTQDHVSSPWLQPGHTSYVDSPVAIKGSPSKHRSYAVSAHPLDQSQSGRYRYTELNPKTSLTANRTRDQSNRETSPELPLPYGQRQSIPEGSPTISSRSYNKYATNGQYKSSPYNGRSSPIAEQNSAIQTPRAEGTESTVSTTAPSTVWDELDDMKSRIRKLELTGKLPPSSGAAIAGVFGERPRTATTTVTTVSSSPKHNRDKKTTSPEASTVRGRGVDNIHPLLHSALARSKPLINPNMYRLLETTATDALTLAAMTGSTGGRAGGKDSTASAVGPANAVDRQLRRKADSMCRSLTELCIALADDKAEAGPLTGKVRPGSRGATTSEQRSSATVEEPRSLRASTEEPEARSSSRIMSRLEARRSSLQAFTSVTRRESSPVNASSPTQTATPLVTNRLDRNSSALLRHRKNEEEQPAIPASTQFDRASSVLNPRYVSEVDLDDHLPNRSNSRIRTESSQLPPRRVSREYTSQHPLPGPASSSQRTPSVHSALPSRRSYLQAADPAPVTPNVQPGNRRYAEQKSTPPSGESTRLTEARERRRLLFEQHAGKSMDGSEVGSSRYRRRDR